MKLSPSSEPSTFSANQDTPPRFITAFTPARHLSVSKATSVQATSPPPIARVSLLIFSYLLRAFFPAGLRNKTLHAPLLEPIPASCPTHLTCISYENETEALHFIYDLYNQVRS